MLAAGAAVLGTPHASLGQSDFPLLESYSFELGSSDAVDFSVHDLNLGAGAAQLRLQLARLEGNRSALRLEVFRHVPAGAISFALLLDRVEIDLLGPGGALLRRFAVDTELGPDGLFIIGDSADGHFEFERSFERPAALRRIDLRLFGNYE
jgi:hypothetical protein